MMKQTEHKMKLVGYFVVGDGKFGLKVYGDAFEPVSGNLNYWTTRGYDLVEVFVKEED